MASNTNASLIKNSKSPERQTPAHILNNATVRTPFTHSIYSNHIFRYTFNITEALRLSEIYLQPPVINH